MSLSTTSVAVLGPSLRTTTRNWTIPPAASVGAAALFSTTTSAFGFTRTMAPSTLSSGLRSVWRASTRTWLGSVRPPLSRSVTPVTSISTVSPLSSVPSLQIRFPHSPFSGLTLRLVTSSGSSSLTITFVARTGPRLSTVIRYRTSSSGNTSGVSATFSIARSGSGTSPSSVSVSLRSFGSPGVETVGYVHQPAARRVLRDLHAGTNGGEGSAGRQRIGALAAEALRGGRHSSSRRRSAFRRA